MQQLPKKDLPCDIEVLFDNLMFTPWELNASVQIKFDGEGNPVSYLYRIPQFAPSLYFLFSAVVCHHIFVEKKINEEDAEAEVKKRIQHFCDGASHSVRIYKEHGLGDAIRASHEFFSVSFFDCELYWDTFDGVLKFIAHHEIAHAYTTAVQSDANNLKPIDKCAFELIADLLATTWLFSHLIHGTPDTEAYRKFRGIDTYAECIKDNAIRCVNSLLGTLLLFALAGAQSTGGRLSLSGGTDHPHGFHRVTLALGHLFNLIYANYSKVHSTDQQKEVDIEYRRNMSIFIKSGVIKGVDLCALRDEAERENLQRAAELIEEKNILELLPAVSSIRSGYCSGLSLAILKE